MNENVGQIYVGFDGTGWFKIGITSDYKKRRQQMRTANPTFQFLFVFYVRNPAVVELQLHTKFESKRKAREWFDLDGEDLSWIYERLSKRKSNLQSFIDFKDAVANKRIAMMDGFIEYYSNVDILENGGIDE